MHQCINSPINPINYLHRKMLPFVHTQQRTWTNGICFSFLTHKAYRASWREVGKQSEGRRISKLVGLSQQKNNFSKITILTLVIWALLEYQPHPRWKEMNNDIPPPRGRKKRNKQKDKYKINITSHLSILMETALNRARNTSNQSPLYKVRDPTSIEHTEHNAWIYSCHKA